MRPDTITSESGVGTPSPPDRIESGNRRNHNYHRSSSKKNVMPKQAKFEGKCEDLKGHIYDCADARQSDMFIKTTREIAEFVGRTYKYGSDARLAVENLTLPVIDEPMDP